MSPSFDRNLVATPHGLVLTASSIAPDGGPEDPALVQAAVLEPGSGGWRLPESEQLGGAGAGAVGSTRRPVSGRRCRTLPRRSPATWLDDTLVVHGGEQWESGSGKQSQVDVYSTHAWALHLPD